MPNLYIIVTSCRNFVISSCFLTVFLYSDLNKSIICIETFNYEEVVYNDNYKEIDGDKGYLYKNPSIVRDRLSSRNPDIPIMKGIGSLLAKRQREIEQEIREFLDMNEEKETDKGYSYGIIVIKS